MNKKFLIIFFLIFLITGCKQKVSKDKTSSSDENKSVEVVMYTSVPFSEDEVQLFSSEEHIENFNKEPDANSLLQIYAKRYLAQDTLGYVSSFSYNSVETDDNGLVHVDLTNETFESITAGDFMETSVIDGIAKTILLNDEGALSITFSVDNEPYQSSQYNFKLNEVYKTKSDYQQ